MNMNNEKTPIPLNESDMGFWIGLLGGKIGQFTGQDILTAVLGMATFRALWKKVFGATKGAGMATATAGQNATWWSIMLDKRALRRELFTRRQVRQLWSRNGAVLTDLAKMAQKESIKRLKAGTMTPEEVMVSWSFCIPKGKGIETLRQLESMWGKNVGRASTGATPRPPIGFSQTMNQINNNPQSRQWFDDLVRGRTMAQIAKEADRTGRMNLYKIFAALLTSAAGVYIVNNIAAARKKAHEDEYEKQRQEDAEKERKRNLPPPLTQAQKDALTDGQKDALADNPKLTYTELINNY